MTEREALDKLRETANKNKVLVSLIGQGYYGTITPPVIQRNILENPAWYTAYTPYQPEISQGRLEALLNYQTMICDLTGLDVANASLLDEATAAAEGMAMAERVSKSKAKAFFVDAACHPQTIELIKTRAEPLGWSVVIGNPFTDLDPVDVFGAIFQYPGTHGHVHDFTGLISRLHQTGAIAIVAADILALTLLKSPGEMGADIAIGNSQRFGVPVGYGGPHAAYMSVKDAHKRSMPGRLVGVSVDARGNRAYRLSLQTREQHIRREKATSNICTAQVLLAVMASMYAVFHGPKGIKAIAQQVHQKAVLMAKGLEKLGYTIEPETFFDTITVDVGHMQAVILRSAVAEGVNLRKVGATKIGMSLDERTRPARWKPSGAPLAAISRWPSSSRATACRRACPHQRVSDASDLPHEPRRKRDDPLHQAPVGPRSGARPLDDPARLLHDEAERDSRNAADHLAGIFRHPPLRARRPGAGLPRDDRRPDRKALRRHRLRRLLHAAELRRAGRICRPLDDPQLPHRQRQWSPRRLPDPDLGPRHQPGLGPDGRHEGRGRQGSRERRHRPRRFPRQGRAAQGQPLLLHDHLPLDPRRVRGNRPRDLRSRP
jgi:glycine cleavage system pyridoxal-binding protein P